jgi:hypothetical protein
MAAATFQKEKDAAEKDELKAAIEKDNLNVVAVTPKDVDKQMRKDEPEIIPPHEPLPTVVSPPSAPISPPFSLAMLARKWERRLPTTPPRRTWISIHRLMNRLMTMLNLPKKRNQKKLSPQRR